jgi:hypothetical protein
MKNFTRRLGMLLVALLAFLQVSAYDFECDGFYYNVTTLDDMTVAVTYGGERYDSGTESYVGDITIPSVASFKGRQFSVTSIGSYAFYKSGGVTSVNIPEGVTSIGGSAFQYCSSLKTIKLPQSVTAIDNYAFYGCSSLVDFCIPDSVKEIGIYAFGICSSLKKVVIPSNVQIIGSKAFYGTGLKTIKIEDSDESLYVVGAYHGFDSFHTGSLTDVYVGRNITTNNNENTTTGNELFPGNVKSITIGDKVTDLSYILDLPVTLLGSTHFEGVFADAEVRNLR